jgi:TolB protein
MVSDYDGYGAREVFRSTQPLLSPDWSSDGQKLAFVSFSKRGSVVKILQLNSGKKETIAQFRGINSAPAWSPDGLKLAYSSSRHGSPDVFIYDLVTKQHQRVTKHYGIETEPAWSPDGNHLLFTSNRTGKPQIYRSDLSGNNIQRISFEGDENANPSYDFEGRNIAMVHDGGAIAVMKGAGGRLTPITNAKFDESPSFSPNGDMLLYATEQGYEPAIMVASADGRVRTRLDLISGDVREPTWSPLK